MGKEPWELAMGEPTNNPGEADVLLGDKVSERKRKQIERQEELDEAAHTAKIAELAKKTATSESAVEKTTEKKEEGGGFKVEGGIKLGTIDYPAMLQQRIEERDELRKQAEEAASRQQVISDDLREKLHASEMLVLKSSFEAQMQILTKMIESNASKGSVEDEITKAVSLAERLGYARGGSVSGSSEMIQVELKKLDFDHQVAMNRMRKEDKAEERRWQIELRRLDDERDAKRAELAQQAKRDEMFANAPAMIGGAIAKGLMETSGEGAISASPSKAGHFIEANWGEAGETTCPSCSGVIGIGPTAKAAVCSGCGTKVQIKRIGEKQAPPKQSVLEEDEE